MRSSLAAIGLTSLAWALSGCIPPEILDCPCADGWRCQEPERICVLGEAADAAVDGDAGEADGGARSDLLAHFTCEELVGTTMVDQSGSGNDARCDAAGCPALVPGRGSLACEFSIVDSTAQRLRVSHREAFASEQFTLSVWVAPSGRGQGSVIGKPYGNARANSWQLYLPGDADSVEVRFVAAFCPAPEDDCPTAGGEQIDGLLGPRIPTRSWSHIVLAYDGTTRRTYIDGVERASGDGEIDLDAHDVTIGSDDNSGVPDLPYDGLVDDIRIYGRSLSADEITALAAE
jgi:hypothetical protein